MIETIKVATIIITTIIIIIVMVVVCNIKEYRIIKDVQIKYQTGTEWVPT